MAPEAAPEHANRARHALFQGSVQGVGFRWQARERALALGLCGWVRNLHDGRVELLAEGRAAAVDELIAYLSGPSGPGHVQSVESGAVALRASPSFEIQPSAASPQA